MKSFEYVSPTTVEEVIAQLSPDWGRSEIMAGGTDLVTSLKQGLVEPEKVVSLRQVEALHGITVSDESVVIGAATTLKEVAAHADVAEYFPAIVESIDSIGGPQIVNVGTLGGDLCQRPRCWFFRNGYGLLAQKNGDSLVTKGDNRYHAIFHDGGPAYFVNPSSLAPSLIALRAIVHTASMDGKREVLAKDFFKAPKDENDRETQLQANELVTAIEIPRLGLRNASYEVRHRSGLDWPYVAAAVAFKLTGGVASGANVVLGHVAPKPHLALSAAATLNQSLVSETAARQTGLAATEGARPLSRNGYKVHLVKTAVKRAVMSAAGL